MPCVARSGQMHSLHDSNGSVCGAKAKIGKPSVNVEKYDPRARNVKDE